MCVWWLCGCCVVRWLVCRRSQHQRHGTVHSVQQLAHAHTLSHFLRPLPPPPFLLPCPPGTLSVSLRPRNYKPKWLWFEAVWAVETVLLSVLAATHFTIGAYESVLLMSLVFFLSACVQGICKPYRFRKLHQVQYGSTAVLFLTTLAALAMFAVDRPERSMARTRMVIAAFTMMMDIGFVVWCLSAAAMTSRKTAKAVLSKVVGCITCSSDQDEGKPGAGAPQETRTPHSRSFVKNASSITESPFFH